MKFFLEFLNSIKETSFAQHQDKLLEQFKEADANKDSQLTKEDVLELFKNFKAK